MNGHRHNPYKGASVDPAFVPVGTTGKAGISRRLAQPDVLLPDRISDGSGPVCDSKGAVENVFQENCVPEPEKD